jgi:6,7-dimethyl-8-ribityllumazine synthase
MWSRALSTLEGADIQTVHQITVAGVQGGCQLPVAAAEVDHQAAFDAGGA